MAKRLTKLLTHSWNDEQKEAVRDAIRFFAAGKDKNYTKEEVDTVMQDLEDKLGERMAEVFRKDIKKIQSSLTLKVIMILWKPEYSLNSIQPIKKL